jgi:ATP-dependent Clp protease ATP-binding subunit ClpC
VVLFDEIEKAHPDVMNMLLQILEDGHLTDSMGRKVDFRNCVIIMTSNIGAEVARKGAGLGFAPLKEEHSYNEMKDKLMEEAKRAFKPEFMNRLDDLIVFRNLNRGDMDQIVHLEVAKVKSRLKYKDVEIVLTPAATEFLIQKGYDPQFGARPLRRAVEKYLQDPLAEEILRGNVKPNETVEVSVGDDKLVFNEVATSAS